MRSLIQWLQQLRFDTILEMLVIVAASLLCITVHETCHGLVAYWLGDDTAKRQGRLTLNPMRHVDVVGLIMMAVARFGWAKPVPVDMRRFRNPKRGMALTAFAGPFSNFVLMLAADVLRLITMAVRIRTGVEAMEYFVYFFEYTVILSAGLAVFNLFPIPPLDGGKVLFALLPDRLYVRLMKYERFGMVFLVVLLFTNILDAPLGFMRSLLLDFSNMATMPVAALLQRLI